MMQTNRRANRGPGQMGSIRLLHEREEDGEEISGIIFTIVSGSSYDHLFTKVKQESENGQVLVYQVKAGRVLQLIQRALMGEVIPANETTASMREILNGLKAVCDEVGPEAICFNFECCAGYSETFSNLSDIHMELTAFLVKEFGCMVMFSDFSLKSLIKEWDGRKLGPNPFVKTAEFSGNLKLEFDCNILKECPSAQLELVGSLSDNGEGMGAVVCSTMSGTIAYTITEDANKLLMSPEWTEEERKKLPYEVQVLTVATELSNATYTSKLTQQIQGDKNSALCGTRGLRGLAGHVLITYPPSKRNIERAEAEEAEEGEEVKPARGTILTSCGHWIELMKIDTNVKRLLEVAKDQLGEGSKAYTQMQEELNDESVSLEKRRAKMTVFSNLMVQQSSPAKYKKSTKRKDS